MSTEATPKPPDTQHLYGLAARFGTPQAVLAAARTINQHGYQRVEAYTPYAVKGLAEALQFHATGIPLIVLAGGLLGCLGGFLMLWYANVISYPLNIGGKPLNSWPAFIPITFEMTVLGASLFSLFGCLALNGLPQPYHPMFKAPRFELATQTDFFLCIEASDPRFNLAALHALLESTGPIEIVEVPW